MDDLRCMNVFLSSWKYKFVCGKYPSVGLINQWKQRQ